VTADPAGKRTGMARDGCWAAVPSGSPIGDGLIIRALFSNEMEALRFAVTHGLKVQRVKYGEDLRARTLITGGRGEPTGGTP